LNTPLFVLSSKHSIEMQNDHLMKVVKPLAPPVGLDTEPFDLNVSCLLEDHDDLEEGGATSPPSRTCMQVALPAASLDHSHHPHSIQKHPTFKFSSQGDMQQQILDITFSDNEADEALGPSEKKPPLSSPSKVLQKLDSVINLCRALALPAASSSARKSPPPPRALQPFPSAFEEELSDNDDEKGYPSSTGTASNYHSPQTPFAAFHTLPRGSTPPPPPHLSPQQGKPHEFLPMVTSAAGGNQQQQHISSSYPPSQTLPQQQHDSDDHDSDDDNDNLVFPLLIARARAAARASARQRVAWAGM
jgi:hypothetical protein